MSSPLVSSSMNRRKFLAAGAALSMPLFFPGCATRVQRRRGPSDRINVGIVGGGRQGKSNTRSFLEHSDCHVVGTSDVDKIHLKEVTQIVNNHYKNRDCQSYHDYRELMARPDIDAVMLAVPDHWHELVAVEAAHRGLDIYGEKPLAKTIVEQQAIVRAVQRHGCIWQTGSWQRSMANFHKAAEIVRNGLIGQITQVQVGLPSGQGDMEQGGQFNTITPPPPELDYNFWLGPARQEPYIRARVHRNWRWNYNTGGGQLMDWVGHHCDIAHWGLGFDRTGPSEIEGHGDFPPRDDVWNTCTKFRIELKYPQNITMTMAGGYPDINKGVRWIGTEGWVQVDRGSFDSSNEDWADVKQLPENLRKIRLPISTNHTGNFLDCVRSRQPTITPVETAHHSTIPGHLGLISMLVNRKLRWDPATETIQNDPDASKLLTRTYRRPWKLHS